MRIENSLKQITVRCCVKCELNLGGDRERRVACFPRNTRSATLRECSSLCTRTCAMREHLDDRQWTASGVRCLTAASTSAPDCCAAATAYRLIACLINTRTGVLHYSLPQCSRLITVGSPPLCALCAASLDTSDWRVAGDSAAELAITVRILVEFGYNNVRVYESKGGRPSGALALAI